MTANLYAIQQYHREVEKIVQFGGDRKETAIRNAFYALLNDYARQHDLMLVAEISLRTPAGKLVTPDGTLKDSLRQDWGYWESKDEQDDLDAEIRLKFKKGYPSDNILFEDGQTAILWQNGAEVLRVAVKDAPALDTLLHAFVKFERPEVRDFREAIEKFRQDVPRVTETLRELIENQATNARFTRARDQFLSLCREAINPAVTEADVHEMLIQHILTADIFNTIFDEPHFHRENNIAKELEKVLETFFTGSTRRDLLAAIQHYFQQINAQAARIADHHEKQRFLKVVYETFYKSYNPKAADRLGVVYTPGEIVKFMLESTDFLLHRHFGRTLGDAGVDILDPATGTGTFVCDLIDFLKKEQIERKYADEIHANEIAILPYYIANLNIEFTYKQKTGKYREFENLCFVDTLDNIEALRYERKDADQGLQGDLFRISTENAERIRRQNQRKISVIIGNPPYNANQQNENENNKNRQYDAVDKRIKDTFIRHSTAQKTKVYDMYARFYRWAFDRLDANGIVAFVTNRSFIDSRTFDGFRRCVQDDFDHAYIIDTRSDVRANPRIAGTTHNVFGIQTGVAIMFLVRKAVRENASCRIHYIALDDFWRKEEKLHWLATNPLKGIDFQNIAPDKNNNWVNLATADDWEELMPLIGETSENRIFSSFTNGISTNRDEWVYDFDFENLVVKTLFFRETYNELVAKRDLSFPNVLKWSETLKAALKAGKKIAGTAIPAKILYRPFCQQYFLPEKLMSDRLTDNHRRFFGENLEFTNPSISFSQNDKGFNCLANWFACDLHFVGDTKILPLFLAQSITEESKSNITDWAQAQFRARYADETIEKEDIFAYTYAVLHCPAYRKKYELNLRREFPRLPLYDDFWQWAAWGRQLLALHLHYESAEPYPLHETTLPDVPNPKAKLRADREAGIITLDEATTLAGIPPEAWGYRLGNRSALEWVLDQYRESKPKDPTIAARFDNYRFAEHKAAVIDLLRRVTTVSVETMRVVGAMPLV
ncbi:MAG: type ISP restriction/modification enzyme [Saprospiraceae bacterium]